MSSCTPQQNAALERAYQMLSEHFDGVLVAVMAETNDDEPCEAVRVNYYGGRILALGLCEQAKERILHAEPDRIEP